MSKINFSIDSVLVDDEKIPKRLIIEGRKLPRPSKRITINQTGIKIISAKIMYHHKKGDIEFEVCRINRIKSFNETRLHTGSVMYPGNYSVEIEFSGQLNDESLKKQTVS
jgi:hypothetical protein